ncbi:MAG: hypothetical protein K8S55_09415, partial [Phycisphaerae bacterium]|nr:hypothetical protein [Phycisphaerae bacterium]
MKKLITLAMLAVLVSFAVPAGADYLTNGDFEATPFDSSWTNGNTTAIVHRGLTATGLDATGTQAAYLEQGTNSGDVLSQGVSSVPLQWQLDFVFAAEDSGADTTRSLNFTVAHDTGNEQINMKLDGDGHLWTYHTGSGWQ